MKKYNKKEDFFNDFPKLKFDSSFKLRKYPSVEYNCISLALGITTMCVWPTYPGIRISEEEGKSLFWPKELPLDDSVDNFIRMFNMFDYNICDDISLERGYSKIAIFAIKNHVTHAALQINEKIWVSKMGDSYVISHKLSSLNGGTYGNIVKFMKRDDSIPTSKYSEYFSQ